METSNEAAPEKWCLFCDKAGHQTHECWSTKALNTPRDRELLRLSAQPQTTAPFSGIAQVVQPYGTVGADTSSGWVMSCGCSGTERYIGGRMVRNEYKCAAHAAQGLDGAKTPQMENTRWLLADDVDQLVKEIDDAVNGAGSATHPKLADLTGQICAMRRQAGVPILAMFLFYVQKLAKGEIGGA